MIDGGGNTITLFIIYTYGPLASNFTAVKKTNRLYKLDTENRKVLRLSVPM